MASNFYEYEEKKQRRGLDKMAWASAGVGFLQGLNTAMERARQERLQQQQIDFQQNQQTQQLGLQRQSMDLRRMADEDTRDYHQAQLERQRAQDEFTQQYQGEQLAELQRYHGEQTGLAERRIQQDMAELQARMSKEEQDLILRRGAQDIDRAQAELGYFKEGMAPPAALRQAPAPAPVPRAEPDRGGQAGGGGLPGMPTMPAPAPAPEQGPGWVPGPGMQPELRHALAGIRPKPSYDEGERRRLDQGQIAGDFLREAVQTGFVPDLKGGRLVLDGQPVPAQALLDSPSLANRIAYELAGAPEEPPGMFNIQSFLSDTNPKSPLGRMGLRASEFAGMLSRGAALAKQDPAGFAALAGLDQRRMPPKTSSIQPVPSRDGVGGGRQQTDHAGILTARPEGAPPKERAFAPHPGEGTTMDMAEQFTVQPNQNPLQADWEGLMARMEAGDPLAFITAEEHGLIRADQVPPQAWAIAGKEPPMAVRLLHQQRLQEHVDQMESARRGDMQRGELQGKQVVGPGLPSRGGYGGGISREQLMRQGARESLQRGQEAYERQPDTRGLRRR